ncbi:MAG: hypothetical protein NDI80_03105 [Flavobacteriaceae bacterium]|nr:hypothetical protein [Flavobacteriaceae bacterium]
MDQQAQTELKSSYIIYENYKEWLSELDFISDEISILEELINSHFIELCGFDMFNKSKEVVRQIESNKIDLDDLKSDIYTQLKYLSVFLENTNIYGTDEFYIKHYEISEKKYSYMQSIKELKKETFNLIKEILIRNKQKKINN